MRIGLDITPLIQKSPTGVQLITEALTRQLIASFPVDNFLLIAVHPRAARAQLEKLDFIHAPNVRQHFISLPARAFHSVSNRWQAIQFPTIEAFTRSLDVYHSFDWFHFPSRAVATSFLFDLTPELFPEWHTRENRLVHENRLNTIVKRAHTIFCLSKATQADLVRLKQFPRVQTNVIYPDCASWFKEMDQSRVFRWLEKRSIKPGYFLYTGTIEPRKNLKRLVEAYSHLRNQRILPELVIAGSVGWKTSSIVQKMRATPGIKPIGYVTNPDLPFLYNGSAALVFPSLYEGFGLTVLEAMRCQTPVMCSNRGSLKEVAAGVSIQCDPESVASIAQSLVKIADMKPKDRARMTKKALAHSSQFNYVKSAHSMMRVFRQFA